MRLVLDTNALIAALRSPSGASAELLKLARRGQIQLLASAALAIEYEAVCLRDEHRKAAGLSTKEVVQFLDAIIDLIEPVEIWFLWRPQLRDPGDELVLEAAVNGRATTIVTFNLRDFGLVRERFGIDVLTPRDTLMRMVR
ncbi:MULTISPECIES: putative toxin-antitoxin system toxin component, PIN family [Methylosinus]|uniref:Putative toxin-antitoxin system toxin component, PIN family n=1 Tax=Methylosinus trichosporium (strain ATCC 35070 / NCIMB 11131 / UNIQEM 75 / OB3b) TaxID=595536 RepID=A0A2D2D7N6_METT3|nr:MULTISPECIES: putative toxin-antitoxin system toxin component, PIN family [Methylosinus]ATQ70983.1 putative toxin-antitoxin system toxin component, PIN family [Methylosinus trichosporium OB3b]OBS50539.1 putative toxin-antitoxin system toxin component, PIN family [Methylosinus sp. 3S-1]